MLNLDHSQTLVVIAAAAFVVGALVASILFKPSKRHKRSEDPRNHQIRQLEADLRTVKRQASEAEQALDLKIGEFEQSVETLREVRGTLADRDAELDALKTDLKGEVKKTRELRQTLQDRATETIREHVRAQEAETELEVARAGSEAVLGEISRLQEERKNLTNTMRQLEENLLPDEDLFDEMPSRS